MNRILKSLACRVHAFLFGYMTRAGLILCDIDPKAIEAALKKIGDEFKEVADKALAQAKASGDMSAEMKPKVDELLATQIDLRAQLLDIQQKLVRQPGSEEDLRPRSAGELVVQSEGFKKWLAEGGPQQRSSVSINMPRAAITSTGTTNTTTVGVGPDMQQDITGLPRTPLTVRDLLAPGRTESNAIQYVRQTTRTNNAAPVSESDKKPESNIVYDVVQSPVVTIAHFFKASVQILSDFKQLQSEIDAEGRYMLKLVEETQLLKGSGVGINLNGIYTQATAFAAPIALSGSVTMIDTLRLMILQGELALYPPTGMVLHPSDWAKIELTKDSSLKYIWANPRNMSVPGLWGLPVVPTQSMTVDTALTGNFRIGAQIFDREDINVVIATQNEDDFVKNMITIRIEERLALAVRRPGAFIKNTNLPAS